MLFKFIHCQHSGYSCKTYKTECIINVRNKVLNENYFLNTEYLTGTSNLSTTYLPTNPASVGASIYNPTPTHYTVSLAHQYGTTNKPNIIGTTMNSLTQHPVGMTGNLGPTGILGKLYK